MRTIGSQRAGGEKAYAASGPCDQRPFSVKSEQSGQSIHGSLRGSCIGNVLAAVAADADIGLLCMAGKPFEHAKP